NRAEFVLVDGEGEDRKSSIVITQKDVRELQLAKAAIRSSIQLLLEATGFVDEDISEVIIAGSFGSYIDVSSAITVGLLPALPLDRFHQVGNAAGMGAKLALVSLAKRKEAEGIASRTHYIELANTSAFKQTFIETSHIGRYRIKQGKREAVT
ncbi:MAG: ASKHA domain-containing protein, partial [Dehalococcoidales bacterium]|nr:ASKHA domain-containing protein [Dehalococcoidales bacterium]